jgi:hypothetical protein
VAFDPALTAGSAGSPQSLISSPKGTLFEPTLSRSRAFAASRIVRGPYPLGVYEKQRRRKAR